MGLVLVYDLGISIQECLFSFVGYFGQWGSLGKFGPSSTQIMAKGTHDLAKMINSMFQKVVCQYISCNNINYAEF